MSAFFNGQPIGLPQEMLKMMMAGGAPISYERISEPPPDRPYAPDRDISPKSAEGQLRALGWRLVPVPRFTSLFAGTRPSLCWMNPDDWLVIPPGDEQVVERFPNRRQALWRAQEQAGLRKAEVRS